MNATRTVTEMLKKTWPNTEKKKKINYPGFKAHNDHQTGNLIYTKTEGNKKKKPAGPGERGESPSNARGRRPAAAWKGGTLPAGGRARGGGRQGVDGTQPEHQKERRSGRTDDLLKSRLTEEKENGRGRKQDQKAIINTTTKEGEKKAVSGRNSDDTQNLGEARGREGRPRTLQEYTRLFRSG